LKDCDDFNTIINNTNLYRMMAIIGVVGVEEKG
jgi:hypothetical protein